MRMLFSPNILSPSPESAPLSPTNPLELSFSSSSNAFASSNTSSGSSPGQSDWLTQHLQNQNRFATDTLSSQSSQDAAQRYATLARRKGNPKIILMGMRRSGKSSIQQVIFEKLSPAETLYLDPTHRIQSATMESFITLESHEFPPTLPYTSPDFDHAALFPAAGALIWVLDMQDEYYASIAALVRAAVFCRQHHPHLHLEVFIHKTDGLSEEYKADTFRDVRQRVQDEITDAMASLPQPLQQQQIVGSGGGGGAAAAGGTANVSFYATSVFDHSVYEAMSKVVQKLLPQLPAMEALLNRLCSTCRIQKAYLFDAASKIYLATDASPTFLRDYEVCSDYMDVLVDFKQIYGWDGDGEDGVDQQPGESVLTFEKGGETYIYAKEMNEYLTLICVMGHGSTPDKRVLIDYNVAVLKEALAKMFQA